MANRWTQKYYASLSARSHLIDVDYAPSPDFRVVQLTPHGSNSSIQFGVGLTDAPPGSVRGLYLVVRDIEACQRD
jgi:hypothetical protein